MKYAVGLPNVGSLGDVHLHVELAGIAEEAGWDGCFIWDRLLYDEPGWPVIDPTVSAAAIAATTERIAFGILMLGLARRRPWKVAKEIATLDRLSNGRVICGAALGSSEAEYLAFGEDPSFRARAQRLDEGLDILDRALRGQDVRFDGETHRVDSGPLYPTPVQQPRPPIWIGGRWPNKGLLRRAPRWDGIMPIHRDHNVRAGDIMPPGLIRDIREHVVRQGGRGGFDLALEGLSTPTRADTERLGGYEQAGLTWWVEALGWWRGGPAEAIRRVRAGPPT